MKYQIVSHMGKCESSLMIVHKWQRRSVTKYGYCQSADVSTLRCPKVAQQSLSYDHGDVYENGNAFHTLYTIYLRECQTFLL